MTDLKKLRYTLEQMSYAANQLLEQHKAEVDVSWIAGFMASIETTLDAISD